MNEEEAEREIIQIAVDPNDVLQNELVLGIGAPPDCKASLYALRSSREDIPLLDDTCAQSTQSVEELARLLVTSTER